MTSQNDATPARLVPGEGQSKNSFHANDTAPAPWPSRIFDVLDRLDRNAAQVLALLRGAI